MHPNKALAIVIPAYKIEFFAQALESIACQTCKDFTLYIGDDASPHNLNDIIGSYKDRLDIVYKRFDENLGGQNLVSHWNRCIEMTQNEEWIWLFSDDDLMESNCVELFYKHARLHQEDTLLHFNIQVINNEGEQLYKSKRFDSFYTTEEYFSKVMNQQVHSCVVEYIFKRERFVLAGGFEPFDLAWSADTAMWMKLSINGGITTMEGAIVKWRMSNLNISSMSNSQSIVRRKINAGVNFLNWSTSFFSQNGRKDITSAKERFHWLMIGIVYTDSLSYSQKLTLIRSSLSQLDEPGLIFQVLPMWLFEEAKRMVKSVIFYNR